MVVQPATRAACSLQVEDVFALADPWQEWRDLYGEGLRRGGAAHDGLTETEHEVSHEPVAASDECKATVEGEQLRILSTVRGHVAAMTGDECRIYVFLLSRSRRRGGNRIAKYSPAQVFAALGIDWRSGPRVLVSLASRGPIQYDSSDRVAPASDQITVVIPERPANSRGGVRPRLRFEVLKRDGFRCHYCGAAAADAALEIDHIVPVSEGGDDALSSLVNACGACNIGKGTRSL